jgi:hypothetical protein
VVADFEFEFGDRDGNLPRVVCLVAKELRTDTTWRLWRDELGSAPPFPIGLDSLFVAFYASAELNCFRALGWSMPARILDLYTEFRCRLNGIDNKRTLILAMNHFGLDAMAAIEKKAMIDLILTGGPWSEEQRRDILQYCTDDVYALERLLPAMLPGIDLPHALIRGRYMAAASAMERTGVPIDIAKLDLLRNKWETIQEQLIAEVDADYGVYDGRSFRQARFEEYVAKHQLPWPRLPTGKLALDRDTFKEMARSYPIVSPLRELRHALSELRLNSLTVGEDGRNRVVLGAFGSRTGRNQPSNSKLIFGPSVWLRGLIKPPPGHAVAYIDWSSQEVGIAAALSGDEIMMADFRSGDPYIAFGVGAGILPPNATKKSHEAERTAIKACVLGLQYGMGEYTLASRIGKSEFEARQLVRAHRERYRKFWMMAEGAVACAMQGQSLQTVFGWAVHPGPYSKERSMLNFPMQANGAEMMRVAACLATERGIAVCAPAHDAFLIEAPIERIEEDTQAMRGIMEDAARIVLNGFTIKTDAMIVRFPDRYMDEKRGRRMWDRVMKLLAQSSMREAV